MPLKWSSCAVSVGSLAAGVILAREVRCMHHDNESDRSAVERAEPKELIWTKRHRRANGFTLSRPQN